jgi:hypothetical protein
MNWFLILLSVIALVCVCLPAIRLKEWLDSMDKEGPDDH